MSHADKHELSYLSPAAGRLGAAFARPKALAVFCVISLAALGWLYLGLQAASTGMFDAFCRAMASGGALSARGVALVAMMWAAMTLAMMLPSASPMILTYAEIADTAARKSETIVSPFALAAGYTAVWFGFAAAATLTQLALTRAALMDPSMTSASGLFSGVIFIGAGLYQFSPLKQACLNQCRHPFPFFFTNWATTARGVFLLGLRQGLFCLGCCWAMMLVMFAVGVMNVIWMVAIGMVMTVEKIVTGKRLTQVVGIALIAIGVVFVVSSVVAHWPARVV